MVYVLLVEGFEEIEALTPIDILRRGGVAVKTVGVNASEVTGSHQIAVKTDITMDAVNREDMDLLILPGGPGHTNLEKSEAAMNLIRYANENCLLAAICASPSILGKLGMLRGKKATCFPGFEQFLDGAEVVNEKAVADGNIITAKGAGASAEFGFLLLELLKDKKTAEKLKGDMQY